MLPLADLHCDTLTELFNKNQSLFSNNLHISLDKATKYNPYLQTFAVYIEDERQNKLQYLRDAYDYFVKQIAINEQYITLCKSKSDVLTAISENKTAAIISIENFSFTDDKLQTVDIIRDMGVKLVSLTWNGENKLAGGAFSKGELTPLGKKAVYCLQDRNITVDVSHLNTKSFYDVLSITQKPLAATHSNCLSICDFPRNLNDDAIKEIKNTGGIIGLNLCPDFITDNKPCTSEDVLKQIEHFLNLGGEDNLCLGCDFDGIDEVPGDIKNISEMKNLSECMEKHGYDKKIIEKIFFHNYIDFIKKGWA